MDRVRTRARLRPTGGGKTEGVSAGAAIVVAMGAGAVIAAVVWFVLNRKHPEGGASHDDPLAERSPDDAVDQGRPAGPGAEADGVAGPGQPAPGGTGPPA
jgi:hypothetical protein